MKEHKVVITGKAEVRFRKVVMVPEDELEEYCQPEVLDMQIDDEDLEDRIDQIVSLEHTVDGGSPDG
jgi:hypothetical protein